MTQFKQDLKICLTPLTTVHNFSEIRFHGVRQNGLTPKFHQMLVRSISTPPQQQSWYISTLANVCASTGLRLRCVSTPSQLRQSRALHSRYTWLLFLPDDRAQRSNSAQSRSSRTGRLGRAVNNPSPDCPLLFPYAYTGMNTHTHTHTQRLATLSLHKYFRIFWLWRDS